MNFIKAKNLIYEYISRDDDTEQVIVNRAIDDVSLDIEKGDFICLLYTSRCV